MYTRVHTDVRTADHYWETVGTPDGIGNEIYIGAATTAISLPPICHTNQRARLVTISYSSPPLNTPYNQGLCPSRTRKYAIYVWYLLNECCVKVYSPGTLIIIYRKHVHGYT